MNDTNTKQSAQRLALERALDLAIERFGARNVAAMLRTWRLR